VKLQLANCYQRTSHFYHISSTRSNTVTQSKNNSRR